MPTRRGALSMIAMLMLSTSALAHEVIESPADDPAAGPRRFMMQDVNGTVVTDETIAGKFTLLYFGYMGCPDVCPTSLMTISEVLKSIGDRADKVIALFVTVDPDRDTAKALSEFATNFDPRIVALRGPKEYTDHMVKAFNAKYEFHYADPNDKTNYTVDHTASIALIGPDGILIKRYPHGVTSADITADLSGIIDGAPAN